MKWTFRLSALAGLLLCPALSWAHALQATPTWHNGFDHPLQGWDHLLAMIAVGIWAAQHKGRTVWLIPLTFVGVMAAGGLVGASGVGLPGVEAAIVLSVLTFGVFAIRRVRLRLSLTVLVVGFFAFAHGFAHGAEMPGSVGIAAFGCGFIVATLLLHAAGMVAARILCVIACFFGSVASAQEIADTTLDSSSVKSKSEPWLEQVLVLGRADSMIGIADSASEGTIGQEQLKLRPIIRPGEILETVPGLIVSQHSGEGKANQYYLRGFNLDHGTDFLTQLEGVPLNLVTHAHGQGWTDTGFLVPELVHTVRYKKGVYYAQDGDFASTGAADIEYFDRLDRSLMKVESGSFDYYRGLFASSHTAGSGDLLWALEGTYNEGPWQHGDHYAKRNAVLRYGRQDGASEWSLMAMGYKAEWNSTDQIPQRAMNDGAIDRFGTIDPTDGGASERYSLSARWRHTAGSTSSKAMAYVYYDKLSLFSDFTYFLGDPVRGDQFAQPDRRWVSGLSGNHTLQHLIGKAASESTFGLQLRNDVIRNGLLLTQARQPFETVRSDDIHQLSGGIFAQNKTNWTDWLRSTLGVRADVFRFAVDSNRLENSGTRTAHLISPKAGVILGPWARTELYLNGGLGFHSNDARGVNTQVDPATGSAVNADGEEIRPAKPLARTRGAEAGLRTTWLPGLQSTLALWRLDLDSELVFSGDSGTTEASRSSHRYGVELANYYSPTSWLTLDVDLSFSRAFFTQDVPEGRYIPGSVATVIAAGAAFHDLHGFFGGPRLRYFGPRPLIEDDSVRSRGTLLVTAELGYTIDQTWTIQAELFNLFNRKDSAIDYFYTSRLPGELPDGVNDAHFHPVEPRSFRVAVSARF